MLQKKKVFFVEIYDLRGLNQIVRKKVKTLLKFRDASLKFRDGSLKIGLSFFLRYSLSRFPSPLNDAERQS